MPDTFVLLLTVVIGEFGPCVFLCFSSFVPIISHVCVCVPFIINQTPAAGGDHCHGPQRAAISGLWAIPSTESGPQPLLVTYNLSSLALTPGEPTPYVCMYVSMVHTHMWYVRGYVLGEEGVNASTSRGRNSKLEG